MIGQKIVVGVNILDVDILINPNIKVIDCKFNKKEYWNDQLLKTFEKTISLVWKISITNISLIINDKNRVVDTKTDIS